MAFRRVTPGVPDHAAHPLTEVQVGGNLRLVSLDGGPIVEVPDASPFAPARWLVHEWRSYVLEPVGDAATTDSLQLVGCSSQRVGRALILAFQNQLGLAPLRARTEKDEVALTLEVLSPKFATPTEHRAFYGPLVRDLARRAAALPFTFDAPTRLRTTESTRPTSDLFAWHFLRQEGASLVEALNTVLRDPRRALTIDDVDVEVGQAPPSSIDSVHRILMRSAELQPVPVESRSYRLSLAKLLERPGTNRRFLPLHVPATRAEETLDTPEHRFIRTFLQEVVNTIDRLLRRSELPAEGKQVLRDLGAELADALRSTFLSDVGELTSFPSASRVLQRAYGYRQLFDCWRLFQLAADPFELLERALAARDVATLYEWWCFYALVDQIADLTGSLAEIRSDVDEVKGLESGLRAVFSDGLELVYNRAFSPSSVAWPSYSHTLRPDFVLVRDHRPLVALDAKFRFDRHDWIANREADDDGGSDAKGGTTSSQVERLATKADLYKMHAYRDALQLRAAVVLYPGRASDPATFYPADRTGERELSLPALLGANPPEGVGALPMSPDGG